MMDFHLPWHEVHTPPAEFSILQAQYDWGRNLYQVEKFPHGAGVGVLLFCLDTGLPSHPHLKMPLNAFNYTNSDTVNDLQGHQTLTAGHMYAHDGYVGLAPHADVYVMKVLGDKGSGSTTWTINAVRKAMELWKQHRDKSHLFAVMNLSLSSGPQQDQATNAIFREAQREGILIFCAAGNANGAVESPANGPDTFAIASINKNLKKSSFSSYGPQISWAAPGENVISTNRTGQYQAWSGTSAASPNAAGSSAAVLSTLTDISLREAPNFKAYMDQFVTDTGSPGPDVETGTGVPVPTKLFRDTIWRT